MFLQMMFKQMINDKNKISFHFILLMNKIFHFNRNSQLPIVERGKNSKKLNKTKKVAVQRLPRFTFMSSWLIFLCI